MRSRAIKALNLSVQTQFKFHASIKVAGRLDLPALVTRSSSCRPIDFEPLGTSPIFNTRHLDYLTEASGRQLFLEKCLELSLPTLPRSGCLPRRWV